jgi:hypothetical protein
MAGKLIPGKSVLPDTSAFLPELFIRQPSSLGGMRIPAITLHYETKVNNLYHRFIDHAGYRGVLGYLVYSYPFA